MSQYRLNVAENQTDRRILTIFLLIIDDLNKLREDVINLTHRTDDTLEQLYFKWSKTLSPRQVSKFISLLINDFADIGF